MTIPSRKFNYHTPKWYRLSDMSNAFMDSWCAHGLTHQYVQKHFNQSLSTGVIHGSLDEDPGTNEESALVPPLIIVRRGRKTRRRQWKQVESVSSKPSSCRPLLRPRRGIELYFSLPLVIVMLMLHPSASSDARCSTQSFSFSMPQSARVVLMPLLHN